MELNFQHTKGPWTTGGYYITTSDGRIWIATVKRRNEPDPEGEANARLLSLGPVMLDQLLADRKLVSEAAMTGFNCHDGDWAERLFKNQAQISAVIDHARGK